MNRCFDFIGSLPVGTNFSIGFGVGSDTKEVFISPSICREANDVIMIKVVTEWSKRMSSDNWHLLSTMKFDIGVNTSPNDPLAKAMPKEVANGDLDKDWYFICWIFSSYNVPPSSVQVTT